MQSRPTEQLFGLSIEPLSMEDTVARCTAMVRAGKSAHHVAINAGKVVLMADHPRLAEAISQCDLVSAVGQGIVWASR